VDHPGLRLAEEDAITVGPPWSHLIPEVLAGRILCIKRGLQQLGRFATLRARTSDALADIAGPERFALVEGLGIERLHGALTADDYRRLISRFDDLTSADSADTLSRFKPGLIPPDQRIYFSRRIFLRIRPPEAAVRAEHFAGHPGSLQGLSAHRDTWYGHPMNMVNVWAALGRITERNGMSFYPDAWGRALPRDRTQISADAELGRAHCHALDPGDMLVFSAEHVHASVRNESDETRVAVSMRFTLGAPRYDHRNGWIPYEDERLCRFESEWLRTGRSRMTRAFLHSAPGRIGPWLRRAITREPFRRV